jgi:2'-5' RNA ligase
MRCFIAIDIDNETRAELKDLQAKLRREADLGKGSVKWVEPENIHLTLKFLGEVRDNEIIDICNITKDVAGRYNRFQIELGGVGSFGGRSARVVWVGSEEGVEILEKIQQELESNLEEKGWPRENKRFSAHLTLCRIKNAKAGIKMAQLAEQYKDYKIGIINVDSIIVFQSQLTRQGPIYNVISKYPLRTTD